jgi:hypothetical protein
LSDVLDRSDCLYFNTGIIDGPGPCTNSGNGNAGSVSDFKESKSSDYFCIIQSTQNSVEWATADEPFIGQMRINTVPEGLSISEPVV